MRARARRLGAPATFAVLATVALAWDGMLTVAFTDYEHEAEPAFDALRAGHLHAFLGHLPAYGGSLIMRAPFALLPSLWHGGALAVYRAAAAPCLLAAAVLGLVVWNELERRGRAGAAWLALGLCVANPITLRALEIGHPEEVLGAALCAGAVLAAVRDRPGLAGLLLGLAVANKGWAVLAIPPVAFALNRGRVRAGAVAAGVAGIVLAPMVLGGSSGLSTGRGIAAATGPGFTPQQIWWFLGHPGTVVGLYGVQHGSRLPPGWLTSVGHLLVLVAGFAAAGAWWLVRRRRVGAYEPLLLLAFVMLVRCLVDPWDIIYYTLPFLFALVAWEGLERRRLPVASLAATLGLWVCWELVGPPLSFDLRSITFLIWALPVAAVMGARLYAPAWLERRLMPVARGVAGRLPSLAPALSSR